MENKIIAIYSSYTDDGQDVWLTDTVHTYYIGTYTGVVGPFGTSTGYFTSFGPSYNLYDVADYLFGYEVEIIRIDLP